MGAIIKNNLRLLLTSKGKLFLLLILPLLIFVLGRSIGGGSTIELKLGLVNPGQDPLGPVLSQELTDMGYVLSDVLPEEAEDALLSAAVDGIIYLPPDLSGALLSGETPPMELAALEGQQFMDFVRVYVERFAARAAMLSEIRSPQGAQELARILSEQEEASRFETEEVEVPLEKAGLLLSSGFFVYLLSVNMLQVTNLLQSEIAWNTLDRIQRSPVRRSHVLFANVATGIIILLINLLTIALMTIVLYGEALPLPYYLVWLVYGIVWIFLGIFLAMSVSLPSVYASLTTILTVLGSMLGGAFVPHFLMSPFLQRLAAITPQYWAIDAAALLGKSAELRELTTHFLALFAFILLFFALGIFSQRRKKTIARKVG